MRRSKQRIETYKGRSTANDKLRVVAMALLLLVILALAALFWGQEYLVYTDNGLRLELPFFQREKPEEEPLDPDKLEVVLEEGQEGKPKPQTEQPLRTIEVPLEAVLNGTAAELAAQQGANGIVLDMKNDQGGLGYTSQQPLALEMGSGTREPGLDQKLRELADGDLYLTARISCFRDHCVGEKKACAIETNPGRRWYDEEGVRWISPASPQVQDYLIGVMSELSQLGFDEILLDNWGYPTSQQGKLEYIKRGPGYDPKALDVVIHDFLTRAEAALAESGTRLSVRISPDTLAGGHPESGMKVQALAGSEGRIWLSAAAENALGLLQQAGLEEGGKRLVEPVSALDAARQTGQVLRPPV